MAMSFVCKTKIEKAWLVTSASIFILHRLLEDASPGCYAGTAPLRMWLGVAMIALSFPFGGLALLALHAALFWCDDCRNVNFLFDWPTLLFAGYIQWFWVLPEILRNRELTLLDLKRLPLTVSPSISTPDPEPAPAALEAASPVAFEAAPLPAFDAAAFVPRLPEFDEAGLTALDRVLQAQPSPRAPASSSHVEAIFPRVS
jgi:hypothetical protein